MSNEPSPLGWRDARCGRFGPCGCEPAPPAPECPLSQRVDGKLHSWRFDGDAPYVICVYCDQMQDARTGRVIREGRSR